MIGFFTPARKTVGWCFCLRLFVVVCSWRYVWVFRGKVRWKTKGSDERDSRWENSAAICFDYDILAVDVATSSRCSFFSFLDGNVSLMKHHYYQPDWEETELRKGHHSILWDTTKNMSITKRFSHFLLLPPYKGMRRRYNFQQRPSKERWFWK